MTEIRPDRDVPQVDFDIHTGEPLADEDATDTDKDADSNNDSEQEQS